MISKALSSDGLESGSGLATKLATTHEHLSYIEFFQVAG